jgi:hypothetical protein
VKAAVFVILLCGASACSSSDHRAKVAEEICGRVADRLEVRLSAHESDRQALKAWAQAEGRSWERHAVLNPTVQDMVSTQVMARELAGACIAYSVPECEPFLSFQALEDAEGVSRSGLLLLDGFRQKGLCAPTDMGTRQAQSCSALSNWLKIDNEVVQTVQAGWAKPLEESGLVDAKGAYAAMQMGRWRALVDYGVALMPVCAPQKVSGTCDGLRRGLAEAKPDDLVARIGALRAAYEEGIPCRK